MRAQCNDFPHMLSMVAALVRATAGLCWGIDGLMCHRFSYVATFHRRFPFHGAPSHLQQVHAAFGW